MAETSPSDLPDRLHRKWNEGLGWPAFLAFAKQNVDAMRTAYADAEIAPGVVSEAKVLPGEVRLLALTEDWCGDCVANLPVVARLVESLPRVELRLLHRDRHKDLMDRFLTNGGMAIPKIVVISGDFSRWTSWGARPAPCQAIMTENRDKLPKPEIHAMIRAWYAEDRGRTLVRELASAIREIGA